MLKCFPKKQKNAQINWSRVLVKSASNSKKMPKTSQCNRPGEAYWYLRSFCGLILLYCCYKRNIRTRASSALKSLAYKWFHSKANGKLSTLFEIIFSGAWLAHMTIITLKEKSLNLKLDSWLTWRLNLKDDFLSEKLMNSASH